MFTREKAILSKKIIDDPHRPQYHFLPPANWINDPNGLIQWNGRYHLFYQHNPHGPLHGTIHWGHAVSDDLVHWSDMPVALTPTPGGPDEDGCFSGCAVDNGGVPTIIYTGVQGKKQLPCIATSTDGDLAMWTKYPGNPVIPSPPKELDLVAFRDHCVWREEDGWYQIIGSGIRDVGGAALLYSSPDLIDWEYMHPLYVGDANVRNPVWTGTMWECPAFFPLGDNHVLVVSVFDEGDLYYTAYYTGRYEDHRFTPETLDIVDYGGHFYAPQTLLDDKGRRIMWGWLWEGRSEQLLQEAGWAGVLSLPRTVYMSPDGSLGMEPVPELQALRGEHHRLQDLDLSPDASNLLDEVRGDALEVIAEFELRDAAKLGVKLRCSPDRTEETLVAYDDKRKRVGIDPAKSSLSPDVKRNSSWAPLDLSSGETLKLHIFLDRSVVEVFANGRVCLSDRIYPYRPDSLGLDLFSTGGDAKLKSLDVWQMKSIWADRPAPDHEHTG